MDLANEVLSDEPLERFKNVTLNQRHTRQRPVTVGQVRSPVSTSMPKKRDPHAKSIDRYFSRASREGKTSSFDPRKEAAVKRQQFGPYVKRIQTGDRRKMAGRVSSPIDMTQATSAMHPCSTTD